MRQPIDQDYDIKYQSLMSNVVSGTTTSFAPQMYIDNNYLITLTIYNEGVVQDLSAQTDWRCGIGDLGDTGPLLEIDDTDINVAEDGADPENGITTIRVNTNSAALEADLSTREYKRYYLELQSNSASTVTTNALFPVNVRNTVYEIG